MTQKLPNKRYAVRATVGEITYLLPDPYSTNSTPLPLTRTEALKLADKYPKSQIRSSDDNDSITCVVEEFHT